MPEFPLPWSAGHCVYDPTAEDAFGNPVKAWADPVPVQCFWWIPSSTEPEMAGHDRVIADLVVVVDRTVSVGPLDRMVVDGREYEVDGEAADYNHGPFGFSPNRLVVECKRIEG